MNNNSNSNCNKYGRLYDCETAKKAAPPGWHLPTDAEWKTLVDFLGGEKTAGGKLKSTTGWNSPNTGVSNSSGFTALPGSCRDPGGSYYVIGIFGGWWSSTESDSDYAWRRYLSCSGSDVGRYGYDKSCGYSVRCVRD